MWLADIVQFLDERGRIAIGSSQCRVLIIFFGFGRLQDDMIRHLSSGGIHALQCALPFTVASRNLIAWLCHRYAIEIIITFTNDPHTPVTKISFSRGSPARPTSKASVEFLSELKLLPFISFPAQSLGYDRMYPYLLRSVRACASVHTILFSAGSVRTEGLFYQLLRILLQWIRTKPELFR